MRVGPPLINGMSLVELARLSSMVIQVLSSMTDELVNLIND